MTRRNSLRKSMTLKLSTNLQPERVSSSASRDTLESVITFFFLKTEGVSDFHRGAVFSASIPNEHMFTVRWFPRHSHAHESQTDNVGACPSPSCLLLNAVSSAREWDFGECFDRRFPTQIRVCGRSLCGNHSGPVWRLLAGNDFPNRCPY